MARRVNLGPTTLRAVPLAVVPRPDVPLRAERALRLLLRGAERLLLRADAQAVAQRNAWHAVCADRERAADRDAAWRLFDELPPITPEPAVSAARQGA